MAIVRLGPAIVDARGSIGGVTFSRTRAGIITRSRVKPIYRQTARQNLITDHLTTLTASWRATAMDATRPAWELLAAATTLSNAVGQPFTPSGFNLYIRANMNLLLSGQTVVTAPPAVVSASGCPFTMVFLAATGLQVSAVGSFNVAGAGKVLCYSSGGYSKAKTYFRGPYEAMDIKADTAFASLPVTIKANANLVASKRYTFRYVHVLPDGSCSPGDIMAINTPASLT